MQPRTFTGSVEELMVRTASAGLDGEWQERPGERFTLAMAGGVALHWSPANARLWLEGPEERIATIAPRVAEALTDP